MLQTMTAKAPRAAAQFLAPSTAEMAAIDANRAAQSYAIRHQHGRWREILHNSDAEALWRELYRIVSRHPVVVRNQRAKRMSFNDGTAVHSDLVQELFVTLLGKNRFQHYLDTEMTDAQIEMEISQIELKNLLSAEMRKRYPESYRLARRISGLIKESPLFRRFDEENNQTRRRSLADQIYGLSNWPPDKPARRAPQQQECEKCIEGIRPRKRDTRIVGCSGDSQLIISTRDLEVLIIEVLAAVDSPLEMRSLRNLVLSRLPLMDVHLCSISGGGKEGDDPTFFYDHADPKDNPEQALLCRETEHVAEGLVDGFLASLHESVKGRTKQSERMLDVLWYSYLSTERMTQLEVANRLGVSDSLVSDYRRRIEGALRQLHFSSLEKARAFELALRKTMISLREA